MNAVTPVLPVDVVSKSLQEMVKVAPKPENAAEPVLGRVSTHLHGGRRWRCVVAGFFERGPTARGTRANCSVIEYDQYCVRKLSSTEVYSTFTSGKRVSGCFMEMLLMAATTAEGFCSRLEQEFCCITQEFDAELTSTAKSSNNDKTYVLPDGNINTVGDER